MDFINKCKQFTSDHSMGKKSNHHHASRLVSLEYSKSIKEEKCFPLHTSQRIFFLCWEFCSGSRLSAAMYPSPDQFCCQIPFENNGKTQRHTHDYIELGYVAKGNFKQRISGKDVLFQEGDFCLIDKNCIHQDYLVDQDAFILFFGIENSMFKEIMQEDVTTQKIISFLQTALLKPKDLQQFIHFRPLEHAKEKMEYCLSLLLDEICKPEIGSSLISKGLLLRIFHLLSTHYEFSLTKEQRKTMNWVVFEEVCNYIQENYQNINTQELMDLFHFQKDYFNRLIKKKTGMTYSEYLQSIRLKNAKTLLVTTDLSISEIAEQVGYNNKGYFYKIFTEKYGMTPAKYKKALEEQKRNLS